MPPIPDRDALEARLARLLGTHFRRTGQTILELLGDPPDVSKIPADFWDGVRAEFQQSLTPKLEEIYLDAAARLHDESPVKIDWSQPNEAAMNWASRYSFELVTGINDTSRRRLQSAIDAYYRDAQTMGELQAGLAQYREFTARAGRLFGPARVAVIAVTEVTRAAVEGEREIVRELAREGVQMRPIWQTSNDPIVCVALCEPRNQKEITDGVYPPLHPNCRCWVGHEFVVEEERAGEGEAIMPIAPIPESMISQMEYPPYFLHTKERVFVYDNAGNVLVDAWGTPTGVPLTKEEMTHLENAHVLHNHPSASGLQFTWTFSKADIRNAAKYNVQRMVAVGQKQRTFIMERPPQGWGDFQSHYSAAAKNLALDTEIADIITNYRLEMEEMPLEQKNDVSRKLWTEYARISGARYIEEAPYG